jgi:hypothetical protein
MYLRTNEIAPPYRPGMDRQSLYNSVWRRHWRAFTEIYPERFIGIYGELSGEKIFEVLKLLSCGDYRNGFRKHTCPDCGAQMIESTVFSYFADREWRRLWRTHLLYAGYFRMKRGP